MALSVNKVTILGNLGRDPEIKTFANGGKVVNLNVATTRTWKDRNSGEFVDRTEWHRVTVTADALIGRAEKWLRSGDRVHIEGRLETRKFQDQSGADRYITEIIVAPFGGELIPLGRPERRDDGGGPAAGSGGGDRGPGAGPPSGGDRDLDDEIPF